MPGSSRIMLLGVWLGLIGLTFTPWLNAQGTVLSAAVTPNAMALGEEARFMITVNGSPRSVTGAPDSIVVPGLTITYSGETSRFVTSNGRSDRTIRLSYSVTATQTGSFVIPGQKLVVDQRELTSPAVSLLVREGAPDAESVNPEVSIEMGKHEMFVGEVVPVSLVVSVPGAARFSPTDHPKMNPEGFALKRFAPAVLARAPDGNAFQYRYDSSISAIQAGEFSIGPAELAFNLLVPVAGLPRQPLAPRTVNRTFRVKADPVMVTVKPLPAEGKPDHFAGAIGQFAMQVSAAPVALKVNDPLVIDVKIDGRGNFDKLAAPVFSEPFGWQLYEARQYIENRSNGLQNGTTAFSQVARPTELLPALPPLLFSYFDPEKKEYVTLASEPVPLKMEADDRPAKTSVEGKDFSMPAASIPREELGDILTVFESPGELSRADGGDARPPLFLWLLVSGYAATAIAIVALGLSRRIRERRQCRLQSIEASGRRSAAEMLEELEGGGKAAKDFYVAAREYLECLDGEARAAHGAAPGSLSQELTEIVAKAEFLEFGASPGKASEAVNPSERKRVIDSLRAASIPRES